MDPPSSSNSGPPTPPDSEAGDVSHLSSENVTEKDGSIDSTALVMWTNPAASDSTAIPTAAPTSQDRAATLSRLEREFKSADTALTDIDKEIKTWEAENSVLCGPGGFGLPTDHDFHVRREQAYGVASTLDKDLSAMQREIATEQEEMQRKLDAEQSQRNQTGEDTSENGGQGAVWAWTPWRNSARTDETKTETKSNLWSSIWNAKDTAVNWALGGLSRATGLDKYGTTIKLATAAAGTGLGLWMASNAFSNAGNGVNQFMSAAETLAFLTSRGPWSAGQGSQNGMTTPSSRGTSGTRLLSIR